MPNCEPLLVAPAFTVALSAIISPALSEFLKREPPVGQLREGQMVLVDNGSCPPGQIKQVIGGNHVRFDSLAQFQF